MKFDKTIFKKKLVTSIYIVAFFVPIAFLLQIPSWVLARIVTSPFLNDPTDISEIVRLDQIARPFTLLIPLAITLFFFKWGGPSRKKATMVAAIVVVSWVLVFSMIFI